MKHHFIDKLNRDCGHWHMTPNRGRWSYHYPDVKDADPDLMVLTLTKTDKNWRRALDFSELVELTLHEPNAGQLSMLSDMTQLRRLRISHARPKSLGVLGAQNQLEEVVLEYVSGIDHLDVFGALPNLSALHLENLRKVQDFSGLACASNLKCLSVDGTLDWRQTVLSCDFLGSLTSLEHLSLLHIRAPDDSNVLSALKSLPKLKKLNISTNAFPLEVFAWLEANLPHVDGAKSNPFWKSGGKRRLLSPPDMLATMPEDELRRRNYTGIVIAEDGKRYRDVPLEGHLLGKGQRMARGKPATVDAKCAAHATRYLEFVRAAEE